MGWADDDNADGDFGELPATLAEPPSAGGDASSVKPQQTAAAPQAVAPSKPGGAPGGRKSYVPPHMRNRPQAQQGSGGGFGAPRLHGGPAQRGSSFAPPPPPGRGGWGGGGSGRDYGGERRRGGWGSRDENPFSSIDNDAGEKEDVFTGENTGINFDAYEDIPVEVTTPPGEPDPPAAIETFEDAKELIGSALFLNAQRCKFRKPTPVQRHSIPIACAGRDLMACAQTGSGKTAAFCFPMIATLLRNNPPPGPRGRKAFPYALVLSPTRELASQIHEESRKFCWETGLRPVVCYGGAPVGLQLREIERGCDILVATPGRLTDLLERARVSLQRIMFLIMDEADRMLDMGFEPQIRRIVDGEDMPPIGHRQTMLFSATFPKEIQRLAQDFMGSYVFLAVGRVGSSTDLIVQHVEYVQPHDKRGVLVDLLHSVEGLTLIFVETKRGADTLEDWLTRSGLPATSIHGDRTQQEREWALKTFRSGKTPYLVATDVAARGLDIPNVKHVINYDLPSDISDYTHRIGRTGRAGKQGLATALFTDKDRGIARSLAELMEESKQDVPGWLSNFAAQAHFGGGGGGRRRGGGGRRGGPSFGGTDSRFSGGSYQGHSGGGGAGSYSGYGGQRDAWD